jgi:hypothetical protein
MSRTPRRKAAPAKVPAAEATAAETAAEATAASRPSPPEGWVGLTRDQFEFALQTTTALLQSLEAMQKAQWDMTHLALERHKDLRQRIGQSTEIQDLVALQVELMRFDGAAAIRSAQELFETALRTATATLEQARSTADAGQGDAIKTWLQSLQSMVHTGIRPLDDLFGQPLLRGLMIPGVAAGGPWPE